MSVQDFKKGIENTDRKLLESLIKSTVSVTDRTGARAMYQIPSDEKYTDVCQYIFAKYGVNMEKYQTSINPFPVLKIKFSDIDALSPAAREFLFSVNVNPEKLQARLNEILAEQKNRGK